MRRATAVRRGRVLGIALIVLVVLAAGSDPAAAQQGFAESADDRAFLAELRADLQRGPSWSALRDLNEYLADFPDSAEARALAARLAAGRGQLVEAEQHLAQLSDADPALLGEILLRRGRAEEALDLARGGRLSGLAANALEVRALDALGRRSAALKLAESVTAAVDDRRLDGHGLIELGRLLVFQRRFERANQALVFADAELNGRKGPDYRLVEPAALLALAEVYVATRQTTAAGADPGLALLDEILRRDPGQPDALALRAAMHLYGMNGRAAEAALQQALLRDPGHVAALGLLARTRLLDRRVDESLALSDRLLADNSRSREALALRAVALTVSDRPQAEAAREAFAVAHPESAALELLLGEVLQGHYRFVDSIAPLRRALELEPRDESPLPVLGQSLAHAGQTLEAIAVLDEHARRSPFTYPWRANMLAVLRKLERATVLAGPETDGFRLRLPPGEEDVLGRLLLARLSAARQDMAARWGVDPDCEVLIEVFDRHADFSVRTVGFEGFMALGACFGCVVTLISPQCELRGQFVWAQTAVHEYAHVVTLELSRRRVPRWLTEGVSVLEERKADPSWTRLLERDVLDARANGQLLPVEQLDQAFRDGSTVMLGYYQGSLICEVIERDFGFAKLRDVVAGYADGSSTGDVVRAVLGIEPAELDRRLLAYVDSEVAGRAAIRPRFTEEGKQRLRNAAHAGEDAAWLPLAEACFALGARGDAEDALRRHLELHGESRASLPLRAERQLADGRTAEARELLEEWSAGTPLETDGLLRLAELQARDGDRVAARLTLERARRAFPGDMRPGGATARLLALAREAGDTAAQTELLTAVVEHDVSALGPRLELLGLLRADGEPERRARLLVQALDIDPYQPELQMELADLLDADGRRDEAALHWSLVLGMRAAHMARGSAAAAEPELPFLPKGEAPRTLDQWQLRARQKLAQSAPED